jgi:N-acetyl-D-muramate 6-phosphate phosphatase
MIKAVLFDLDGTLADTAPDLAYAINTMRAARGMPPLPLAATRPVTSLGARGLLNVGFGVGPDDPSYSGLREEFLRLYEENICRETRLFPGAGQLLDAIETRGARWGVVTNKIERLARLLLGTLDLTSRASCIIGGDTAARAKPHPEPLLAACSVMGLKTGECIYVGDDRRDVEAGQAAGMKVAAARWGYLNGGQPESWNADWIVEQPGDVLRLLLPAPPSAPGH